MGKIARKNIVGKWENAGYELWHMDTNSLRNELI